MITTEILLKMVSDAPRDEGIIDRYINCFKFENPKSKHLFKAGVLSLRAIFENEKDLYSQVMVFIGDPGFNIDNLFPSGSRAILGKTTNAVIKRKICQNILTTFLCNGDYERLNDIGSFKEFNDSKEPNSPPKLRKGLACAFVSRGNKDKLVKSMAQHGATSHVAIIEFAKVQDDLYKNVNRICKKTLLNEIWKRGVDQMHSSSYFNKILYSGLALEISNELIMGKKEEPIYSFD